MKRTIFAALLLCMTVALAGCGDDYCSYYYPPPPPPPPPIVVETLSDPAVDGYIAKDPVSGAFTVTQGMSSSVQSVVVGINPANGPEFRAFLDFPAAVPVNAVINSALLNISVDTIQAPTGTIPVRIDLVSFPPPLNGSDFDSAYLATVTTSFLQSDVGQYVISDLTPLMVQAQLLHLTDFQIRIVVLVPPGSLEINDTTGVNRQKLAPLLKVTYF